MAHTIFKLMLLLGIGLAAFDVAEAGAKVTTIMRFPDETFTADLRNSSSDAYKNLTARIEDKVGNALKAKNDKIMALKVNGYTNGSIVVNSTVELAASVDPATVDTAQLVKNATKDVANDATFTSFKIDSSNINTTAEPTTATTTAAPGATTTAASTTAASGSTTTAASGATTTAASGTTTAAAAGSGSATTTAAAGSGTTTAAAAGAGSGTTTAAAGSGSGTTTAAAGSGTTTAAAGGSGSTSSASGTNTISSTTRTPTSGTSGSNTLSSGATTGATTPTNTASAGATGGSTGTSGTAGSTGTGTAGSTSSTANTTARIPVKVDETSLGGMAVIIALTKTGLPSVAPYIDITKPEYGNLMGALPALTNMLKATSEADKILSNVELKQVIAEDSSTIRAEYVAKVAKETSLAPLQAGMDGLNKKEVFKIDGTTHRVEFIPLTVPNRWHSLRLRLPSKIFTPEMKDPSYAQFKSLQTEIQTPLTDLLRAKVPAVRALYIQELISGSVIVRASVETDNTSTNATTSNLANALSTVDSIGTYNVDTDAKSKSVTGETYIYGAHTVTPVPESQLPARTPITRDTENIKKGQVTIEGENVNKTPIKRTNYFFTVTIPSFVAVLILIILFLCCTTSDSCLCKICSNEPKSVP